MNWDLLEMYARERTDRPTATLYAAEMLNEDRDGINAIRYSIGDVPLYKAGDKAGKPNYQRTTNKQEQIALRSDLDLWVSAWSERTGMCTTCAGDGEEFKSWSSTEGTTMQDCRKCNGMGSADGVTDRRLQPELVGLFALDVGA